MQKFRSWLPFAGALAVGLMVSNPQAAQAQVAASVTVNASTSIGTIPAVTFVNTAVFDNT